MRRAMRLFGPNKEVCFKFSTSVEFLVDGSTASKSNLCLISHGGILPCAFWLSAEHLSLPLPFKNITFKHILGRYGRGCQKHLRILRAVNFPVQIVLFFLSATVFS